MDPTQLTYTSVKLGYKSGSQTLSQSSIVCYSGSQNSGEHYYYQFLINDANGAPEEEAGFRRGASAGASAPVKFGMCHPPSAWMRSPTQKLSKPHGLGLLWRLHDIA